MLYSSKFFKNEKAAARFQEQQNGVLFCGLIGSHTRADYHAEAQLAGMTDEECSRKPYCVVYNVVADGPIEPTRPDYSEFMPRILGEVIYACRKCGAGYTEGAVQELHDKGIRYYRDGWDFICPDCYSDNDGGNNE